VFTTDSDRTGGGIELIKESPLKAERTNYVTSSNNVGHHRPAKPSLVLFFTNS